MELEEDGGYCTLSPSAEVMLQGGEGGRGTLSKVKSLGREGLHGTELVKLFFFFRFIPETRCRKLLFILIDASDYELVLMS